GLETSPHVIEPYFPFEVTPGGWALVDLSTGARIASTTGPTLTISSQAIDEERLPPMYAHVVVVNNGCPGFSNSDNWSVLGLISPTAVSLPIAERTPVDVTLGDQAITVTGWMNPELAQELGPQGLLNFQTTDTSPGPFDAVYDCDEQKCNAITLNDHFLLAQFPPIKFWNALRARPAP